MPAAFIASHDGRGIAEFRQLRRTELRETKVIARENLRDFKKFTGETRPPGYS